MIYINKNYLGTMAQGARLRIFKEVNKFLYILISAQHKMAYLIIIYLLYI
jgi:hypothetical protein